MGIFEALVTGAAALIQPVSLLTIFIATLIGIFIGVMPAMGQAFAALFLAFVYYLPPEIGINVIIAIFATCVTGGSITAIALNIPGTEANMATLLDGFPMSQRGEGARAIGVAVGSSMFGGVLAVPLALVMIPLVLPIVMLFKSPEMFFSIVLALSFIAALVGKEVNKGLISACIGILLSAVGVYGPTGTYRFTFGSLFLIDGLGIVPLALGLFALPAIFDMILSGQATIARTQGGMKLADVLRGVKDVFVHKWLWLRSTVIGYIVGVIPGIGNETAVWVTYGQAKATSKNPEKFGTGCVEGIIAPESANNAKEAGALLTTLALGIPGSTIMALVLAGLLMTGITPGPRFLIEHLPLGFTLFLGLALCNFIAGIICLVGARYISRVAFIHLDYLLPAVLTLVFAGVYALRPSLWQLIITVMFGFLGLACIRYGYSQALIMLGFILGDLFEYYFFMALKMNGPIFFTSPTSLVIIVLVIAVFIYPYLKKAVSLLASSNKKVKV